MDAWIGLPSTMQICSSRRTAMPEYHKQKSIRPHDMDNFNHWKQVVETIFDKSENKEELKTWFSNAIGDMLNFSYSDDFDYKHAMEYFSEQLESESKF